MTINRTSRRELLALGGVGALATLTSGALADDAEPNPIEAGNEKLVNDFCAAWATLDLPTLSGYLAEDVVYQIFEGMPLIEGREAFEQRLQPFLADVERAEWEILRSHAIGNLVINERIDHFYRKDDKPAMHFSVAGFFLVKSGNIQVWKDYGMPKQEGDD